MIAAIFVVVVAILLARLIGRIIPAIIGLGAIVFLIANGTAHDAVIIWVVLGVMLLAMVVSHRKRT